MSNFEIIEAGQGRHVKAWRKGVFFEQEAIQQLINAARLSVVHPYVAAMPDAHKGYGSTVGSVIPTQDAVIPAAVGVDIGCFTGDTEVVLADSKSHRLDELANSKAECVIYSCTPLGRIFGARATARLTRKNSPLILVTLDNGESVRCTPDQKWMLRDGSYTEAQFLQPETSLMPFYARLDEEGYLRIQQPNSEKWQRAHWTIARSGLLGSVPKFVGQRTVIHHKDFNGPNNSPENLQFMGDADHAIYHRNLVAQNGERGKEHLVRYNQSEKGRAKSREIGLANNGRTFSHSPATIEMMRTSALTRWKLKKECAVPVNHKVVSVMVLEETADVYCLTVPEYANFALAAGVFVHNCGMVYQKLAIKREDLPENLVELRAALETAIPNGGPGTVGAWPELVPAAVRSVWMRQFSDEYDAIGYKHPDAISPFAMRQLGTLGTGNHFIELTTDSLEGNVGIVIHSGSRGLGNKIGTYFTHIARQYCEREHIGLPDRDLAYLPRGTEAFDDYLKALAFAQRYAWENRLSMLISAYGAVTQFSGKPLLASFGHKWQNFVHCFHNYMAEELHFGGRLFITRKGAVRANYGDLGIIPGSMGARTYIVRGLGSEDSFKSCSHGAGRAMSRTAAKKAFTVEDHIKATEGVECDKTASTLDETPGAYKNIEAVMAAQSDLVEPLFTMRQFLCVKGIGQEKKWEKKKRLKAEN